MSLPRGLAPIARAAVLALVALVSACQDAPTTAPLMPPSRLAVSEARFGGGNPDFFFATPLAASPSPSDAAYDEGASNGELRPYVRVCVTDGAAGFQGCLADVTSQVTGSASGLPMGYTAGSELYQVNWSTDRLNKNLKYRVEIWGVAFTTSAERSELLAVTFPDGPFAGRPRWLFGWRDIGPSPSVAACKGDEPFCLIKYGQTLPIRVRIEDFAFCPALRNCAMQFVAAGADANLEATLDGEIAGSAQLLIPAQAGTDFPIGFEPCTAAEKAAVEGYSALPTFGPCLKTATPPTLSSIQLSEPARISFCLDVDFATIRSRLAVPDSQEDLIGVHHFSTDGDPSQGIVEVEAWAHATPLCEEPTSGGLAAAPPRGALLRLAELGVRLLSKLGPQPLMALHFGGGGEGFDLESYYMLALPTKFEYVSQNDANQFAPPGSTVTLRAKATDLNGDPVWGARLGWAVVSSPDGGASVSPPPYAPTGVDGIAQVTVTLAQKPGENVFHATGLGIADDREVGCTLFGGVAGAAPCNGPRVVYDPFQPQAAAAFGGVVRIPTGTRLRFTVSNRR